GRQALVAGRVAKCGELAPEDAARVDVDRAVKPVRFGDRRVAVHDHSRAPVLGCPVVTDGQAELVGLAGRLTVQREVADLTRTATLHLSPHPSVGDNQRVATGVSPGSVRQPALGCACVTLTARLAASAGVRLEPCQSVPSLDLSASAAWLAWCDLTVGAELGS